MHRHGYQGRKFHRETDQRRALMKSLADSLIIHEQIKTTLPKAKELVPYIEKLVTRAKEPTLANRRIIISRLQTKSSAHKLVDEIAPRYKERVSGHVRVKRTTFRRGDNAQLAIISFIENNPKEAVNNNSSANQTPKSEEVKSTPESTKTTKPVAPKKSTKATAVKPKTTATKKETKS